MTNPEVKAFFDEVTFTWTYIVWEKNSANKKCAVIDSVLDYDIFSGRTSTTAADKVISFIKEEGLELEWILETHIHADHLTAAQYIKKKLGGKTAISENILKVLKTWQGIFNNNEDDTPLNGSQFDYLFKTDEVFKIGNLDAKIINTPGHTPADTTYIIGECIFAGDVVFMPDIGSGRCDFPEGSAKDSYNSIQILFSFPDAYKIYVGHDYPEGREAQCVASVKEQKENNKMLNQNISKNEFITKRETSDKNKAVPKLLLPSIQVNLRGGSFGEKTNGVQYIKVPVNKI